VDNNSCDIQRRIYRSNLTRAATWSSIAVFWVAGLVTYATAMTNNDVAWYLTSAEKWISGARLYDRIVEVNPPLIFYINAIPAFCADIISIPAEFAFVGMVFALIGLCVVLTARVTARLPDDVERWALSFSVLIVTVVLPSWDFGQREHLMLIFCLPYVLLAACRAPGGKIGRRLAVLIGMLAGIGFCLKPQFLIVPLVIESYLIARLSFRSSIRRVELHAMIVIGIAYAVSIPIAFPEYFTRVIPYALLVYNQGLGNSPVIVFGTWQTIALPAMLFAHLVVRRWQAHRELGDVLCMCGMALYVVYASEMKGWTYQILPASATMFLWAVSTALTPCARVPALIAAATMLIAPAYKGTYHNATTSMLAPLIAQRARGNALYVFSDYVWTAFPLVREVKARWPSRFPSLWLLPGAETGLHSEEVRLRPGLSTEYEQIEEYTTSSVVEDLERDPPTVIIVQEGKDPRYGGRSFDYIEFFSRDPGFAEFWSNYTMLARVKVSGDLAFGVSGEVFFGIYRRATSL
jgi:hypothetical protein